MTSRKYELGMIHLLLLAIPTILIVFGGIYIARNIPSSHPEKAIEEGERDFPDIKNLLTDDEPQKTNTQQNTELSPTITQVPTPTTTTTSQSTPTTQQPMATQTPSDQDTSSSNPYDLSAATGAVKVTISASSGSVVGDQVVELLAQDGYKVLLNQSTDKDTRIARQGSEVNFSQVPGGPYSVRIQYKGQWTSYKTVTVSPSQLSTVSFSVVGETPTSTPTPTPKPKPACYNPIVYNNDTKTVINTGNAPFNAMLQPQGQSGAAGTIVRYEWDYTSSGTWDSSYGTNPAIHTYNNPGTYTVKLRVYASNGKYSDPCQTTITVN